MHSNGQTKSLIENRHLPLLLLLFLISSLTAANAESRVNAVLFIKPHCQACGNVIDNVLNPVKIQYGEKVKILVIDNSDTKGGAIFLNAVIEYGLPSDIRLPVLMVGDHFFSGYGEIKAEFPEYVASQLRTGGVDWPDIRPLERYLDYLTGLPEDMKEQPFISGESPIVSLDLDTMMRNVSKDPAGNVFAILVLIGIILCVIFSMIVFFKNGSNNGRYRFLTIGVIFLFLGVIVAAQLADIGVIVQRPMLLINNFEYALAFLAFLVMLSSFCLLFLGFIKDSNESDSKIVNSVFGLLILLSLITSGYLAYAEVGEIEASCGAIGDCNAVQDSVYATLFGIIPVSVLGLTGCFLILASWVVYLFGSDFFKRIAGIGMWGLTLFGSLFFVYLTFLEPFVIGATCFWCITSAIAMGLLNLLSATPATLSRPLSASSA